MSMPNKDYKLKRMEDAGFKIRKLRKVYKATRGGDVYVGSVSVIFKAIFGY